MNFAEPEKAGKVLLKKQCGGLRAEDDQENRVLQKERRAVPRPWAKAELDV